MKKNLESIRSRIGMSQEELGKKLGVPKSNVSAWENGTRTIPPKHYDRIKDVFGLTEKELQQIVAGEPMDETDREKLLKHVVHDFSEKVANLSIRRAEIHRAVLLNAIHEEIRKLFPDATEEDRNGILRDLANGTTSEGFIFAEVSRMNSSIAEIAKEHAKETTEGK